MNTYDNCVEKKHVVCAKAGFCILWIFTIPSSLGVYFDIFNFKNTFLFYLEDKNQSKYVCCFECLIRCMLPWMSTIIFVQL